MSITVTDNDIFFAKMRPDAIIPTKKLEDAGYDFYSCFDEDYLVIEPLETKPVPTGIACAFTSKYYFQVEERSGMGKMGIKKNGGVFDSGYRGEYLILTFNTRNKPFVISKVPLDQIPTTFTVNGKEYYRDDVILYPSTKAICQLVLQEIPVVESKEISYDELLNIASERGAGRFGHSGK